jgi:DNA-binding MarR family transcriptional regulator
MKTLCRIRDIYRAISEFEVQFQHEHNLNLNEGMLLCSLHSNGVLSSGEIANVLGLTPSNASKVITSTEKKGLIKREFGNSDKRQMYFSLTDVGKKSLTAIECDKVKIPEMLESIIEKEEADLK